MENELISSESSVASLLKDFPQTARVFITQKTACVGCYMAVFCTLKDVISTYEIDDRIFFLELNKVISVSIRSYKEKR